MIINKAISCMLFTVLMTGCSSVNLKNGPILQDLSGIPVPRSGGPALHLQSGSDVFADVLRRSGYFSSVSTGATKPSDLIIETDFEEYLEPKIMCFIVLWTAGILPCVRPKEEVYTVIIKNGKGRNLWASKYRFKGTYYWSFWPYVYLLGATEERIRKSEYSRITSNLLIDLNKLGLISE